MQDTHVPCQWFYVHFSKQTMCMDVLAQDLEFCTVYQLGLQCFCLVTTCLSACLLVCLSAFLVVWLSACPACLLVCLSGYLVVWLSGCLVVWLSACPACLPVCLSAFQTFSCLLVSLSPYISDNLAFFNFYTLNGFLLVNCLLYTLDILVLTLCYI